MIVYIPKEINTETAIYKNGANKNIAEWIIGKLSSQFGFRELEILENLETIEQNNDVPQGYIIYRFFDESGNGFEAGKTPSGYSITN